MQWNWKGMFFGLLCSAVCMFMIGNMFLGGWDFTGEGGDAGKNNGVQSGSGGIYTPAALAEDKEYYADINMGGYGKIIVKLNQKAAPITAANFVALARDGFYDGLTFHRIISGMMMQGGDPNGDSTGGSEYSIVGEFAENGWDNPLKHERGVISMSRSGDPNSASSQFFIMHRDYPSLDGKYAAFGEVVSGMTVVDLIVDTTEIINNDGMVRRTDQPKIVSITIREEEPLLP